MAAVNHASWASLEGRPFPLAQLRGCARTSSSRRTTVMRSDGTFRGDVMSAKILTPLKVEHEELHAELVALTEAPGKVGAAARRVAVLLHPHFVIGSREDHDSPRAGGAVKSGLHKPRRPPRRRTIRQGIIRRSACDSAPQQPAHKGSDGQTNRATTGSRCHVVSAQDRRTEDACA